MAREKKLNLNSMIRVKLTDRGKDYYQRYNEFMRVNNCDLTRRYPTVDEEGFSRIQLHEFMNIYGQCLIWGYPNIIEGNDIYIEESELEDYE